MASAGGLGGALLNVSQLGDGFGERGKPGDQGHDRECVVASDGGGCSEQARGLAQAVAYAVDRPTVADLVRRVGSQRRLCHGKVSV